MKSIYPNQTHSKLTFITRDSLLFCFVNGKGNCLLTLVASTTARIDYYYIMSQKTSRDRNGAPVAETTETQNHFRTEDSRGGTLTGSTWLRIVTGILKPHIEHRTYRTYS